MGTNLTSPMNKIFKLIQYMISGTFLGVVTALFIYLVAAFVYFDFKMHQDPTHYFSWFFVQLKGLDYKKYLIFAAAFEVLLLISGIRVTWRQIK